jgi:hypothetical protein
VLSQVFALIKDFLNLFLVASYSYSLGLGLTMCDHFTYHLNLSDVSHPSQVHLNLLCLAQLLYDSLHVSYL